MHVGDIMSTTGFLINKQQKAKKVRNFLAYITIYPPSSGYLE